MKTPKKIKGKLWLGSEIENKKALVIVKDNDGNAVQCILNPRKLSPDKKWMRVGEYYKDEIDMSWMPVDKIKFLSILEIMRGGDSPDAEIHTPSNQPSWASIWKSWKTI